MAEDSELQKVQEQTEIRAEDAELERVQIQAKIRETTTRSRINDWNEYVGFAASKLTGLAALVVGGLESMHLLHTHLVNPEAVAGAGLALLAGKTTVTLLDALLGQLKPKQ